MKVASLGSGSRGNSVYVEAGGTRVLIDAGFSGVQIERRLAGLDIPPEAVDAVVLTHEHRDHTSGAGVAARRWGWPLYMSEGTREACGDLWSGREDVVLFEGGEPFRMGALHVTPFLTCHDAVDPLAVTVREPGEQLKLGIATDLGRPTAPVRAALSGCHFLILEANHDEIMLRDGPYPWSVKQRIGGSRGHLSNRMAAELAQELSHPDLAGILLAHLSRECNDPDRARSRVRSALAGQDYGGVVEVARQDGPSPLFDVGRLLRRADAGPQMDLFRRPAGS